MNNQRKCGDYYFESNKNKSSKIWKGKKSLINIQQTQSK